MIEHWGPKQFSKPVQSSIRFTGPRRRAGLPASIVVGFAATLAIMILAPSVGASSAGATPTTLTAPYSGTPVKVQELITYDCGSVSQTHGPKFDLTSGVAQVLANASVTSAASCRSPLLPSAAEVVGLIGFTTLNFTLSTGTHTVKADWDLHWTVDLKASRPAGNPSNLQTAAVIEAYIEVYDMTTKSEVNSNEWSKEVNRTGDASVHFVGSKQLNLSVSQTYNATHVYAFLAAIEYEAIAEVAQGAPSGQASATINMATDGNGATLLSLKGV